MSLNLIFHISDFHNLKIASNIFFFIFEGGLKFLSMGVYIRCLGTVISYYVNLNFSHVIVVTFEPICFEKSVNPLILPTGMRLD